MAQTAQSSDKSTGVDELTVTAQKRAENVEDVPLSVNVVGEGQLERQQVTNIFDLSRVAPSLELTNAAGQNPGGGGQIRGLGTQSFGTGAVGSVGIVVDGVSQGNANISDLFDISRVEVLKGPQGTLFGLTTSAGVINITTQAPNFTTFSAHLHSEDSGQGLLGSEYGQQVYQGAVNIPISSTMAVRISGSANYRQGPDRNALDNTYDAHNSNSLRARLLWEPTDKLTVNLNADYSHTYGDGPDFFTVYKAVPSLVTQLANCRASASSPVTPIVASPSNVSYCSNNPVVDGDTNWGGSISVDYNLGPLTLTSITAARQEKANAFAGLDIFRLRNAYFLSPIFAGPVLGNVGAPSDLTNVGPAHPGPSNLITQEFRIASPTGSRLEYTAGLFYSNYSVHNYGGSVTTQSDYSSLNAAPVYINSTPVVGTPGTTQDYSDAVFGQATFHITDKLAVIGGLRYTDETLRQHTVTTATAATPFAPAVPAVATFSSAENKNTSWRAGLQYKFDPTLNTYITVSEGYKGPQFATPICAGTCPAGTPGREVLPEIPTDYEIGAKKTLFDGRVIVDLNAFYIKMKDYQGQICVTNAQLVLTCTVTNYDGVISKGVEANVFGRVSDNFTLSSGLIWNPATFPEHVAGGGPFISSDGSNVSGAQLVNAPVWKYTFSGEYSHPLSNGNEGFISGDLVFKSKIRYAASTDPLLSYGASVVVGGRIGVRTMKGWEASLFVRNLGNEHTPVLRQANFPGAGDYGQFLSSNSFRVVGLQLNADF
jgi:iron complex outermembrane receptor protein